MADRGAHASALVSALEFVHEPGVALGDEAPHVPGEYEAFDQPAERPERGLELDDIGHERGVADWFEFMFMPPAFERTTYLLINESCRAFVVRDTRGHREGQPEMLGPPSDRFAWADFAVGDTGDSALS